MIHTCKYPTAERRRAWGKYRDPESGWSKTEKSWFSGRKCHRTLGIDPPVIDTNKRRGIVPDGLSINRKIGIDLRWEIV